MCHKTLLRHPKITASICTIFRLFNSDFHPQWKRLGVWTAGGGGGAPYIFFLMRDQGGGRH